MSQNVDLNQVEREKNEKADADRREAKRKGKTLQTILDEYLGKGRLKPRTIDTYKNFAGYISLTGWSDWLKRSPGTWSRPVIWR